MMDKSAFNAKIDNLVCYTMADKSEIQTAKNKYPYCALLQMMDVLSDKAIGLSQWEHRFSPRVLLYFIDEKKFSKYLSQASLVEVHPHTDAKTVQPDQETTEEDSFDIKKEIQAYQEVSFKTAPKSVILSKFLETGNYNQEDLGETEEVSIEDLGKMSITENDSLDTETLAIVLEKQGKWEKAIAIYEKLIVKYPEKSSTFAIRISELKMKIENNKK